MPHKQRSSVITGSIFIITIFSMLFFLTSGCEMTPGGGGAPVTGFGTISGTVKDVANAKMSGVKVEVPGKSPFYTDINGYFLIPNVAAHSNVMVKFSMDDYVPNQQIVTLQSGSSAYLTPRLKLIGTSETMDPATGGTVSDEGGSITINPDSLTGSSSNVTVQFTAFDPTVTSELNAFPGDFAGRTQEGAADAPFETFGYVNVTIMQGTTKLNLKSGATAEIHIPVPISLRTRANSECPTIDLWYYDETLGRWILDGVATLEQPGHSYYWAIIRHLSWWNCDQLYDTGYITGEVVDQFGTPIEGAYIKTTPVDWTGSAPYWNTITDVNGKFTHLPVKAGGITQVYAARGVITSTPETTSGGHPIAGEEWQLPYPLVLVTSGTMPAIVKITPATKTITNGIGGTAILSAEAKSDLGSVLPGKTFTWWSSDNAKATVEASGTSVTVWGMGYGTCEIYASCEGVVGSAKLTIFDPNVATVTISPTSRSVLNGGMTWYGVQARNNLGTLLTGKTFTWGSGNTGIATVGASGDYVYAWGMSPGTCGIYATCEGVIGTAEIKVGTNVVATVEINPASVGVVAGNATIFAVQAKNSIDMVLSGKTFTWWSSDNGVATVDASGSSVYATGNSPGTCVIYASCEGVTGSAEMTVGSTVVSTVSIDPSSEAATAPGYRSFSAQARNNLGMLLSGKVFTWWSSNTSIAIIDASGSSVTATGKWQGTCTIYASCEGVVNSALLTVSGRPWSNLGSRGFSGGVANYESLFIYNGIPYVAYYGGDTDGYKATVMSFEAATATWEPVGSPNFSSGSALSPSLQIYNGTLYLAFVDGANGGKATVVSYEANSGTWVPVGNAGFSSSSLTNYISLYVYNGIPYVSFADTGGTVHVMSYEAAAATWETVGSGGLSVAWSGITHIYVYGGIPYVAYGDNNNSNKAVVMQYDPGGNTWEAVGPAGFSGGLAAEVSLKVYDGIPYIAYKDYSNGQKATVMKYDSGDNTWEALGGLGISTGQSEWPSLFIYNGIPYVAYEDSVFPYGISVLSFEAGSNSWVSVGTNRMTDSTTQYTSLFIYNGIPYVAYQDWGAGFGATVSKCGP